MLSHAQHQALIVAMATKLSIPNSATWEVADRVADAIRCADSLEILLWKKRVVALTKIRARFFEALMDDLEIAGGLVNYAIFLANCKL